MTRSGRVNNDRLKEDECEYAMDTLSLKSVSKLELLSPSWIWGTNQTM